MDYVLQRHLERFLGCREVLLFPQNVPERVPAISVHGVEFDLSEPPVTDLLR